MPRGFGGVREASADLEARRGTGGPNVLYFRLKANEEAEVRFLEQDDEIFWAWMHEIPVEGRPFGRNIPCLDQRKDGTPCPGCERDMDRRFKGFINLIWFNAPVFKRDAENKIVKDSTGDPVVIGTRPQVAVWNSGIRLFEELDEINANFKGLRSRRFRVKRKGSGLDTKYMIAPMDVDSGPQDMNEEEKRLLGEKNDLAQFTTPSSYDEFVRDLNGGGNYQSQNSSGGGGGEAPPRNPFMRNR